MDSHSAQRMTTLRFTTLDITIDRSLKLVLSRSMNNAYQELAGLCEEVSLLGGTASTLGWDQETYLPKKALAHRADQLSYLSGKIHAMATGKDFQAKLEAAEQAGSNNLTGSANLREWRHGFDKSNKLPQELVERASQTTSLAKAAWADAREKNEFNLFAPHLEKLVSLAKE